VASTIFQISTGISNPSLGGRRSITVNITRKSGA
jgi:hypothetical protein